MNMERLDGLVRQPELRTQWTRGALRWNTKPEHCQNGVYNGRGTSKK